MAMVSTVDLCDAGVYQCCGGDVTRGAHAGTVIIIACNQ